MASVLLNYHENPRVRICGPIVGMFAQPVWMVLGWLSGAHGLLLTATFFFFIHVKGYRTHKKCITANASS
jgi:hypothetical protein